MNDHQITDNNAALWNQHCRTWQAALTDVLEKIVKVADEQPFCSIGHIVEHVVPEIRDALAAPKAPQQVSNTPQDGEMRDKFERLVSRKGIALDYLGDGIYGNHSVQLAWEVLSELAPPQSEEASHELKEAVSDLRKAAYEFGQVESADNYNLMMGAQRRLFVVALSSSPTQPQQQESAPGQEALRRDAERYRFLKRLTWNVNPASADGRYVEYGTLRNMPISQVTIVWDAGFTVDYGYTEDEDDLDRAIDLANGEGENP